MMRQHHELMSRRHLLRVGVLGGVGLSLADYLRLQAQGQAPASESRPLADSAIFIHLAGGPSHLDTLDIKPQAPADERGEFGSIQTAIPGLLACEHLPKLARAIDRFTLIRGISHAAGAHPIANQYLFTGNPVTPAVEYPAMGSVAMKERPVASDLPAFVAVPSAEMAPGYLGIAYSAFTTSTVPQPGKPFAVRGLGLADGLTIEKVQDRNRLLGDLDRRLRTAQTNSAVLEGMDQFGQTAAQMILSARTRQAFDTSREPPSISALFGPDEFGQSLLLAVRLVEFGVRFVTVSFGAWDTHLDNFVNLKTKLLPPFDTGITGLVEALRLKGLLDRTLVVATGEFGRTPTINKNAGRDHWPRTMWTLVTGGGVRAGQLIGGTDAKGHGPDDSTDLKPDDLAASIYHALGIDAHKEYLTRAGRPVQLVAHGRVIPALFEQATSNARP